MDFEASMGCQSDPAFQLSVVRIYTISGIGIDSRMVPLKKNSIGIVMRIGTRLRELESKIARVVHH